MATLRSGGMLHELRGIIDRAGYCVQPDAQLLQEFIVRRDEGAFNALLRRHAALVWGVCRHILASGHDAEDAFQATFLILARRAAHIRKTESIGSWLHSVAYRVAVRARQAARKRHYHEQQAPARSFSGSNSLALCELQALLDAEVERLPEKYRASFVLCCLEGRTRDEAARELGANENTISSRIARARKILQARLARRGVTLSAALCASALGQESAAATMSSMLLSDVAAVVGETNTAPVAVSVLAEQTARALALASWRPYFLVLLAMSLLIGSAGLCAYALTPNELAAAKADADTVAAPHTDRHGDPLPRGAIARLGTARQRAAASHVAIGANGKEIITLSPDLVVRRFDAHDGTLRSIRLLPDARPYQQSWLSPHGAYAALIRHDQREGGRLELWELDRLERRAVLPLERLFSPAGVAFSKDGRRIGIIGSSQNKRQIHVWDWPAEQSRLLWSLERQIDRYYLTPVIALSADGKHAVACHLDLELRAWNIETGKLLWDGTKTKRPWSPFVSISPDGRMIAATSGVNSGLALYDLVTGAPLEIKHPLPKKPALIPVGFAPDSQSVALESGFEEFLPWNIKTGRVTLELPRPARRRGTNTLTIRGKLPTNFAFTPDGAALIRRADILQRWEVATGKPVFTDSEAWGHTEEVTRLAFAPDGKSLVSIARDRTARVWDLATLQSRHALAKGGGNHLAFLPDGRHILMEPFGLDDAPLKAWDVVSGKSDRAYQLKEPRGVGGSHQDRELCVTADGKRILMLSWKNGKQGDESMLSVWDAKSGDCLRNQRVPWSETSVFLPDGSGVLAVDSRSRSVRLLDMETEAVRTVFETDVVPETKVSAHDSEMALSADGRRLASRIRNYHFNSSQFTFDPLCIHDVSTGRCVAKLPVEGPAVFAFSGDNRLFALAGAAGIRLWETITWKEVSQLTTEHPEHLAAGKTFASALAFAPDGRTLATGHADCTVLLWDATLRAGARGRPLTEHECASLWDDLAGPDAARAFAAVWKLADDPPRSLPLLRDKVQPVMAAPAEQTNALLKELDSLDYPVRQRAGQKLHELGDTATPALHAALKTKISLEQRRRIEAILEKADPLRPLTRAELASVRAVHVLEQIDSPEARAALTRLAKGADAAPVTQAAQAASGRLGGKR